MNKPKKLIQLQQAWTNLVSREKALPIVNSIINNCKLDGNGIMRYPKDVYDGSLKDGWYVKKGAGAWPLLNFLATCCYAKIGQNKKAEVLYNWVLDRVDNYIPEQIHADKSPSITPLCWSHAMFILATKELNVL